jgi:hypothetical protein
MHWLARLERLTQRNKPEHPAIRHSIQSKSNTLLTPGLHIK